MLAKCVAKASGMHAIFVDSSELRGKTVGSTEKAIRDLFEVASAKAPCMILIDQLEVVLPAHAAAQNVIRTTKYFLTEFERLSEQKGLFVIATTPNLQQIEKSALRSGKAGLASTFKGAFQKNSTPYHAITFGDYRRKCVTDNIGIRGQGKGLNIS
ncbi:ATPase family associated with various cellular activities-domain-containing protein [Chytridium lagenaria]|nr:ATPase family associated with various cellular activities-domain-containing protein [Chytridium lagenaria]